MSKADLETSSVDPPSQRSESMWQEILRPLSSTDVGDGTTAATTWVRRAGLLLVIPLSFSAAGLMYFARICEGLPPGSLEPPAWSDLASLGMRMPLWTICFAVPVGITFSVWAKFRRIRKLGEEQWARLLGQSLKLRLLVVGVILTAGVLAQHALFPVSVAIVKAGSALFGFANAQADSLHVDCLVEVHFRGQQEPVPTHFRTKYRGDYIFLDSRGPYLVTGSQVLGLRSLGACRAP